MRCVRSIFFFGACLFLFYVPDSLSISLSPKLWPCCYLRSLCALHCIPTFILDLFDYFRANVNIISGFCAPSFPRWVIYYFCIIDTNKPFFSDSSGSVIILSTFPIYDSRLNTAKQEPTPRFGKVPWDRRME